MNSEATLSIWGGSKFGSSSVSWFMQWLHPPTCDPQIGNRHLFNSSLKDWTLKNWCAAEFREVLHFSPAWLAPQKVQGTALGVKQQRRREGKEQSRTAGTGTAMKETPLFQFQRTQILPNSCSNPPQKCTHARTVPLALRFKHSRGGEERDKSSRRRKWVVLLWGNKNSELTDCKWEEGKWESWSE